MDTDIKLFKKDFMIVENLSEINFTQIKKEKYKNEVEENAFGEKLCILYTVNFSVFNVSYGLKILVFIYDNTYEILKLDLNIEDSCLEKEIADCRNFLRRHRNLNSTFLTLKKVSRFFEARRLIIEIVLKKEPHITSIKNKDDGSIEIKYENDTPVLIVIGWKVHWDLKNCDIVDEIEVYHNTFEGANSHFIKEELESLTHPSLEFPLKLKMWKQLFSDLSEYSNQIKGLVVISDTEVEDDDNCDVLVISDSDEEKNRRVEEATYAGKRRKIHNSIACSSQIIVGDN